MALDKSKILSELNSVMSQLQDADCGCMDKLFSPECQSVPMRQGCRGGCCRRMPQFSAGEGNPSCKGACTGGCNPVQMYTDTYNFLNKNLMQPTVQEVMGDLQTMNASNTAGAIDGSAGDPGSMSAEQMTAGNMGAGSMGMPNMGGQMGMHNGGKMGGGNMGMPMGQLMNDQGHIINGNGQGMGRMGHSMGGMGQMNGGMGQPEGGTSQAMSAMDSGMGEQIMNMMNSSGSMKGMPYQGGMTPSEGGMMPNQGGMGMGAGKMGIGNMGMPMDQVMTDQGQIINVPSQGMGRTAQTMGGMGQITDGMGTQSNRMRGPMSGMNEPINSMNQQVGAMGTGMGEQIMNMMMSSGKSMNPNSQIPNKGGMMPSEYENMPNTGRMMPNQGGMTFNQGGMMSQGDMGVTNKGGVAIPIEGGTPVPYQGGMAPNQGGMMMNQAGMSIPSAQGGMMMPGQRGMQNQGGMQMHQRRMVTPNQVVIAPNQGDSAMDMQSGILNQGRTAMINQGMGMKNQGRVQSQGVMDMPSQGSITVPNTAHSTISVPPGQRAILNPNVPANSQGNVSAEGVPCIANPHNVCRHNVCSHGGPRGITFNQLNTGGVPQSQPADGGGDLGFDPMAIALQMNPANAKLNAINTMNNLMTSNRGFANYMNNFMGNKPVKQISSQQAQQPAKQPQAQQQQSPIVSTDEMQPPPTSTVDPSQTSDHNAIQSSQRIQNVPTNQVGQSGQIAIPPRDEAAVQQTYETERLTPATRSQQPIISEPIYPINSIHPSRRLRLSPASQYEFNTLGQPMQLLPTGQHHPVPQQTYPRELMSLQIPSEEIHRSASDPLRQSYVKSTISRTSIPRPSVTRIPSRGQTYVNRQSYSSTGPNERQANQRETRSDGRLYQPQSLNEPVRSIEEISKVAGDATSGQPSGYPPAVDSELLRAQQEVLLKNGVPPQEIPPPTEKRSPKGRCNGLQDRDFLTFQNLSYSFGGGRPALGHSPTRRSY